MMGKKVNDTMKQNPAAIESMTKYFILVVCTDQSHMPNIQVRRDVTNATASW
jgi:hypothetical protein